MAKHPYGVNLYRGNNMARTIAEMIAPEVTESDATMADVYGLKSQAADKVAGVHTALAGAGMIPAVGNIADAVDTMLYLTEGDLGGAAMSALSAIPFLGLAAGGIKTVKSGAKAIKGTKKLEGVAGKMPEMAETMPRTSTYQYPSTKPKHRTYPDSRTQKLRDRLDAEDMDAFEELEIRRELDKLEPEWDEAAAFADQPGTFTSSGTISPDEAFFRSQGGKYHIGGK